ncbi:MAG: trans-2-enoyl-CoA reductase family protein, partial [Gammaproteobacteria bacterium]|nr:trans-2-enoyl-CoA reductase family protein [Gammaproteobacteria bacterium]
MIVKPRVRGFICTTAHPVGCKASVENQISIVAERGAIEGTANALIVGASGGYGLASRIVAAFGCGAATLGVSLEKPPRENKTASAGWYNNIAFEQAAHAAGLYAKTLDGDAFSDELKAGIIETIRQDLGEIDLLIYSLASPVRRHPRTGVVHRSAIKPLGDAVHMKTLNVGNGDVHEIDLDPATEDETLATIEVMGGEDWGFWIDALLEAGVLAKNFCTVSYTYIGSELTWPIYWDATLGKAKEDVDRAAAALRQTLAPLDGRANVAALKAVVTQSSSAIPVVPLYISLLFRVMKDAGNHEDCIHHIDRLFRQHLYADPASRPALDESGRIRLDDRELAPAIQNEVERRWREVTSANIGA